ncbi:2,3-bisphosphoglycerate-independent phosphoglycerate mutase [Candidatus Uhrbacteria bacterium CG_4_9_14_3_um_filter_50_9]|uniref:2,3-bisphosphoglycerate-independent phosphoglycerate mutase n=1 Tax=Candidatus Uhrbacteria bacterium CG_4_9_14_3_um_filter_50_9 TaxID=1975035 RepID=A0A2M7XDH3_9BACT|nr:MAG: 2,3-bisphosphoglycerate-independent phosphoglycerate mutase [Candidatus Uhrbacteria bacterium CG_4_9_14_3_um_filter_50_9]
MPDSKTLKAPTVLVVIDGFGVAPDGEGNAIKRANTPNFDRFVRTYPAMTLRASGEEVGLSWGEMGNSEVGHLAIGAGRVYYQMFPRINRAMAAGEFATNEALLHAVEHVKKNNSRLHLIGMVSQGRVHSMDEHCHALLESAKAQGVNEVYVQAITDGRDTVYNAGIDFLTTLQAKMDELGVGKIASLSGRYFAMDRDNRWDRIQKAYNAMVLGEGEQAENALEALKASYQKEVYDEEFVPTVITEGGQPVGLVQANDAVIFFNFRPDRMRQLAKVFVLPDFDGFNRTKVENLFSVTMAEYEKGLPVEVAFPPERIEQCLAQVISEAGLKQLHIAETEKYAHVTFFLNGTKEDPFPGEERVIIPSPKVAAYNEAPEMSAKALTDRVLKEMQANTFDFIVMNFANPDMVGHTGDFEAAKIAVETVDEALGKIAEATLVRGGVMFVTADHGNAEELKNLRTGDINKEHATNPVPFLMIGKQYEGQPSISGEVPDGDLSLVPPIGMLADVAPTVLAVMGLEQPAEMTGQPLV